MPGLDPGISGRRRETLGPARRWRAYLRYAQMGGQHLAARPEGDEYGERLPPYFPASSPTCMSVAPLGE
jgi:hypothetical protein